MYNPGMIIPYKGYGYPANGSIYVSDISTDGSKQVVCNITTPWGDVDTTWFREGDPANNYVIYKKTLYNPTRNVRYIIKVLEVDEAGAKAKFQVLSYANDARLDFITFSDNLPAAGKPGETINYNFEVYNNSPSNTQIRWLFATKLSGTEGDIPGVSDLESLPPTPARNKNCWYEDWAAGGVCANGQTIISGAHADISGSITLSNSPGMYENARLSSFVYMPDYWGSGKHEYVEATFIGYKAVQIDPCAGVVCSDICIANDLWRQRCDPLTGECVADARKEANALVCTATHFLDIKIKPNSWYTPGGAADWIASHLVEINGKLLNVFKDITDYQYLGVSIFTDAEGYVVIRTHLKSLSVMSLGVPALAAIADIILIILAIVIVVGIIVGVYLITNTLAKIYGKDYTKAEVGDLLNDILARGDAECNQAFPTDPVGYANCMKALTKSVTGAGSDFFKEPKLKTAGEEAASKIDACVAQYNLDLDKAKLEACVKGAVGKVQEAIGEVTCKDSKKWDPDKKKCIDTADCWISGPIPGTCILSAKTGTAIVIGGGLIIGTILVISLIKK